MPQIIQIEGELVRILDTNIIREARLDEVMPHLEHRPPLAIGPIPKTAKFMYWDESNARARRAQFLCELPPARRTVPYNNNPSVISIPWTYFLFDFRTAGPPSEGNTVWEHTNSRIFWARQEVVNYDSQLRTALVPNCDGMGGICYGGTGVPAGLPLNVRVDRLVAEFYATNFTHDSGAGAPWQSQTGSHSWARWIRESENDPEAWNRFPEWENNGRVGRGGMATYTVRQAMGSVHDRTQPIQLIGAIPAMTTPFTFGRAEEWLRSEALGATEEERRIYRHRLLVALQNLHAEDPGFAAPAPEGAEA